ncbi:outer membrane beta-barrel protein [Pseudoalteromonas tunicata]|uniref:outer membrane beta-barrel protein n=1 Tax=Pseudoalteromonas tunicata TaxID=314281 RepID=UPI00273E3751|nr:outer membrane beta-barrel protein [Pseudoalteromonas tunicata]MDP4983851.1 outer membrane beta-barrel protein [Pseudoalteromonas tunicata]
MKKSLLATALAGTIFNYAHAVEPAGFNTESGIVITPLLNVGVKNDNNIFSQPANEESSAILTVDPTVNFLLSDGINSYSVDAGLKSATYFSSSDDNYLDGFLAFDMHLEPSSQSRFDLNADLNWVTEPRGTGITEGLGDSVDEPLNYSEQILAATYEFGALSTNGKLAFDARYYNKGYSNFEAVTQYREYDSFLLGTTLSYNTGAATDLFLELSKDAIRYEKVEAGRASLSSDDYRALIGVKWEATALTTGSAKIGYQNKDFESDSRANFSGLSWNAGITWQPLTYTLIDFSTSRAARDPSVEGSYIKESVHTLGWTHGWNQQLNTRLGVSYTKEDYSGVVRKDDTTTYSASATYALFRWVDVGVFADFIDKNSTRDTIYFDKTVVGVNFTFAM